MKFVYPESVRVLCGIIVGLALMAQAWAAPLDPKIDRVCRRFFKDPNGPGGAVAVIVKGKVIHAQCYGMADVKRREPITATTGFDLASVSKQFTATCILLLSQRGRLRLDDDVRRFLPEMPSFSAKRPIRITDLLTMRSGLPEYEDDDSTMNRKKLMAWLKTAKLDQPTGTKYEYINTNYALLGFVVESASGQGLRAFLQRNVFDPLGMSRTTFFDDVKHPPQRAMGYKVEKGKVSVSRDDVPNMADGNVFSCLQDMIVWERALRNATLLGPALQKQAWTRSRLDNGKPYDYGFGWEISAADSDDSYVQHTGAWYGASTYISLDFTDGESIIVLCNAEDAATEVAMAIDKR